ncbi:MAG: hypothetical protein N2B06_08865 [Clostridium sp.]
MDHDIEEQLKQERLDRLNTGRSKHDIQIERLRKTKALQKNQKRDPNRVVLTPDQQDQEARALITNLTVNAQTPPTFNKSSSKVRSIWADNS